MTLRHMKIFNAVYQTGNITKAAEQLYMTQPAVTRAIQELERYYGVRLFERIKQRLSVTEAGRQFYSYTLHIIDSLDQMEKSLRNWDELGIIRVGASMTPGSMLLPKVLKAFQHVHAGLTVRTTVTNEAKLQYMLENNELDFALIGGVIDSENLVMEELSEDHLILLVPPGSDLLIPPNLFLADLYSYPLLLREKGSVSRILIDHIFAMHNMTVTPLMESISTHAIVQGVHEGLGISFLPELLVQHSVKSGFVASRPVNDESFLRKNYIVHHKNKFLSESAKNFISLCHAEAENSN